VSYGPWFWLHTLYSYIALLLGTGVLILSALRSQNLYRWQVLVVVAGAIAPWIGNALYVTRTSPVPNLDLTPFAFALSGVLLTAGLFRLRLFDVVPVARSVVIEHISDAVIVLDDRERIVDLNPVAADLCDEAVPVPIGLPAQRVLAAWWPRIAPYLEVDDAQDEFDLLQGVERRYYDFRMTALRGLRRRLQGRLIVVRDITERKRAERELQRQALTFEHISDSIILTDVQGRIVDCNPATERMFGYNREEL
jgi:PAS domain-containing protein